jgi:hypothetical protein
MHTGTTTAKEKPMTTHHQGAEELDYRESDGVAVSLLWQRQSNQLTVAVVDARLGESFTLSARPDNARDVFNHPYAYAQPLAA